MCSDGAGGAIVVWVDHRDGNADIYCQRADPDGDRMWTWDGIPVCVDASPQTAPAIAPCASGGAIIVWVDQRGEADLIYAQRVTGTGSIAPGWPTGGLVVSSAANAHEQLTPQVISDGDCGGIIVWVDRRTDNFDIYAQRVDQLGVRRWAVGDVALCVAPGDQINPHIASDGTNGVIATWEDNRAGNTDIYARKVDSGGTALWTPDGTAVYSGAFAQTQPVIASGATSGAIIGWTDDRGGSRDIYAQRLNGSGSRLWPPGGVLVCGETGAQQDPAITADGSGGAIIAWRDGRSGQDDIYVQRLDGLGVTHCLLCGVALCAAPDQQYEEVLAPDGAGGVIAAWIDLRSVRAGGQEIYAMRLAPECGMYATGIEDSQGSVVPDRILQSRPNPFNAATVISYSVPVMGHVTVSVFDIAGRCLRTLVDEIQSAGLQQVRWGGELDSGALAASGTYFYSVKVPGGTTSTKKMVLLK